MCKIPIILWIANAAAPARSAAVKVAMAQGQTEFQVNLKLGLTPRLRTPRLRAPRLR